MPRVPRLITDATTHTSSNVTFSLMAYSRKARRPEYDVFTQPAPVILESIVSTSPQ
jgi:hypothetical protein